MSRFLSQRHSALIPYVPGEQPQDRKYIKLNTNESPFPPAPSVEKAAAEAASCLQLYSDPENRMLGQAVAELYGVEPQNVILTNGSDEILNFAFMAFCDEDHPAAFPDITYGFYRVFANLNHIPFTEVPLQQDYSVNYRDYCGIHRNIFIANPNAPTGLMLKVEEIEEIIRTNPDNVVVIDEAYGDFAGTSVIPLVNQYSNLLVTRTFSKSYSMAGARLGMGIGFPELISDLNTLRYSTNPYNVNRMTAAAGLAALQENAYYMKNCRTICETRQETENALKKMGFTVLDSQTNFLFAGKPGVPGETLYLELKKRGILVRYFNAPRTRDYIRITVGTRQQMQTFLSAVQDILERG